MKDETNILFIMCDQLRWDYLSCYGHPHLETPNIDRLAARGVRFTRAYCQAPLCGPSRASILTGRYMSSHGATTNEDPLKLGELTLGDYMRDLGVSPVLVGKVEVSGSEAALARLGVDPDGEIGRAVIGGGFEPFEKLEGLYPDPMLPPRLGYNEYLRTQGYRGENPWELYANSATGEDGRRVSGWNMRHAGKPARVAEAHSETAFTSDHGDYLGDHWLGEKDLFHECSARIPMIISDPSPQADATRGTTDDRFVESVDLLPTFVEFAGGEVRTERVEGRSLLGILRGEAEPEWRDCAVSEIDFSGRGPRTLLDLHPWECRAHMLRTVRWKYILHERFRPQLFDLDSDPGEFVDLGDDPGYEDVRREFHDRLFTWFRRRRNRTEMPEGSLFEMGPERNERLGIMIGRW